MLWFPPTTLLLTPAPPASCDVTAQRLLLNNMALHSPEWASFSLSETKDLLAFLKIRETKVPQAGT